MRHTSLIELIAERHAWRTSMAPIAVVDTTGHLLAFLATRRVDHLHSAPPSRHCKHCLFWKAQGAEHFGFDTEQIALMCASHNSEERHAAIAERMLGQAGLRGALRCGCHATAFQLFRHRRHFQVFDARYNNCSGKHAGFLAYRVQHQLPLENYTSLIIHCNQPFGER